MYDEVLELACLMMGEDYDTIINEGKEGRIENMLFDKKNCYPILDYLGL